MPYKSKAQMRYLHAANPKLAKEWDQKYDAPKDLPEKVGLSKPKKKLPQSLFPKSKLLTKKR